MLHNFCPESAPRHVRDFYLARLYRQEGANDPSALGRVRARGDDGRFVTRADELVTLDVRDRKVCGWCRTTTTSQWRVGPTNGSVEMGTLCNACGINYRRALAKSPGGVLNLDRLAEQMGHTRLSIQKALKRQRKLSAPPPHQFKRPRPTDRFGLARLGPSVNMLLQEDIVRAPPLAPRTSPLDSPVFPTPRLTVPTVTLAPPVVEVPQEEEEIRLPPFEAFIGDLERRRL